MRIRSEQIIFFLIISIIPLSAVVYVSYEHSQEIIRNSVNTNLLVATENTGKAIDNWMDARKDDIRVISVIAENSEKETFGKYLGSFQNEHEGVYREFFIIDPDGNTIFSTLNYPANVAKEPFLKNALEGRLSISDVSLSSTTNLPEVIITNPIRKNDTITGIMGARVSIENLYMIIEGIDIGRSGEIFLVNNKGELIFHKDRFRILHENINNNFAVKEVIYEKRGVGDYINYKGENVLGSYYWLPLYRWGLIVEQNRDEAYANMMTLEKETAVISLFAVFCVVLVAIVISKRMTEPIELLKNGAVNLVKGHFKPISITSKNEIGELTEIFNQTAEELLEIRKKLETKIELANIDLEKKNKELIRANEELKKLDNLKSDFLSLVSHELKTPLSAIRTSAEFLESDGEIEPEIRKEMLDNVINNIDRLTRLINDILDLSKIEAGKMEFYYEKVNVKEIAKVAVENIRYLALKNNIAVSMEIPEHLSPVIADRDKIIIVLNNLLSNALKFTYKGGSVVLLAKEEKDNIEIRIEDTGMGIDKDKIAKIFNKFYQADSTSRRRIGGSGLGLTISSEIIMAHGGEICVESEPQKGSIFYFKLKKYDIK